MSAGSHVPDSGDEIRGQQGSHREVSSVPNRTSLWNAGHLAQGARGSSRPDPAWAPSAPGFRRHLLANARKGAPGQGRRRRGVGRESGRWPRGSSPRPGKTPPAPGARAASPARCPGPEPGSAPCSQHRRGRSTTTGARSCARGSEQPPRARWAVPAGGGPDWLAAPLGPGDTPTSREA